MFEACQACNKEIEVENEAGKRNNLDLNILTENINTLQEHIDQKLHSTTSSGLKDCLNIECQHRSVK
jgi:ribosomal protein S15P/S13E